MNERNADVLSAIRLAAAFCLGVLLVGHSLPASSALPAEASADAITHEWPSYNNGYSSQRFVSLSQIDANNVKSLHETCRLQLASGGSLHTGPVVIDRTMYVTTPYDTFALDPTNCSVRWKSTYKLKSKPVWPVNRGVAVMNGRVFRGTVDGRLLALDASTGGLIWEDAIGGMNEFISAAPLAWNGLVLMGTTGGDLGIKGRIFAFDAATGREVWHFVAIPTGTQVGADSWRVPGSANIGGGGTWSSFSLDIVSGEVFVPIANPAPSFAVETRPGANLFTDSVVVLDALTGHLKWWYQLVPNDGYDRDLAATPALYNSSDGQPRFAAAGKDGYLHIVDRETHNLLYKIPTTTFENDGKKLTDADTKVCPGWLGGTQWNGPAVDVSRKSIFVGSVDWCMIIRRTPEKAFVPSEGHMLLGATMTMVMDPKPSGWITAVDSDTGKVKWKYHAAAPVLAALTPTAGGVLFAGDIAGHLLALDSATGKVLLNEDTGGALAGGIISYEVDNQQYVAFDSGNVSRSTFGAVGVPTLVIMSLGKAQGGTSEPGSLLPGSTTGAASDPAPRAGSPDANRGHQLYLQNCSVCHGTGGEGGSAKSLRDIGKIKSRHALVQWIENPLPPMPKLFPAPLDQRDVADVAAFVAGF